MSESLIFSLKPGVVLVPQSSDTLTVQTARSSITFKQLTPALFSALQQLTQGGATELQLHTVVMSEAGDGPAGLYKLSYYLRKLGDMKVLCHTVSLYEQPLATIVPLANQYQFQEDTLSAESAYRLSRFAYMRQDGGHLLLESPLGYAQVILHTPQAASLVAALATARQTAELAQVAGVPEAVAGQFLSLVVNAGAAAACDAEGHMGEETSDTMRQWEFHDLLFHARSREGRHSNLYGGAFPFVGQIAPLPAVKPPMSDSLIPLAIPDLERLKESDAPLSAVIEGRHSIREFGEQPLTREELGEFLYRTARVKAMFKTDKDELSYRPYPGGGAVYELEIYPVVDRCQGLESGLYHYRPLEHQLCKVTGRTAPLDSLLELTYLTLAQHDHPQVLLVFTARFQRVAWKYRSMVYALILKHVGVLYQNMYLVATAMGLAPCALGGGNADLFAAAAGLNYYAESSVGEFVLGSKR